MAKPQKPQQSKSVKSVKLPPINTEAFGEQDTRENTLKTAKILVVDDARKQSGMTAHNKLPVTIDCAYKLNPHAKKDGTVDSTIWIERRTMANKFVTPYIRIPSFIPMDELNKMVYENGTKDGKPKFTKLVTMYHGSKKCVGKRQIEAFIKVASANNDIKEYVA